MGPPRKSRSVNKRFSYGNDISPTKDGDSTKKNQRKKKLSDMLGPHWSKEELECFYDAYRKHGKDWRKVAAVFRNRSVEMVEAVYSLNRAYLSLPEGTASVAGFIAMMTDYYSNKEDRDSEQERNDGVGTSRKPQKRVPRKVHETTSRGSVERFLLHPEAVPSDYGCLSLLKKKRSGGGRPRAVGKRTPRFPVSHTYENIKGERYFSPTKRGLKQRADDDKDVAHSIAMALAEASRTPNRRSDSLTSSPRPSAGKMDDESDVASHWFDDDVEGSMEADNTDFSRDKFKERLNGGYALHDRKVSEGKKVQVDKKESKHLDYIREACSGTEGQNLRRNFDVEAADVKPSRSSSRGSKKRSKESRIARDESSAFDALETLANLSLMILPDSNGNGKDNLVDDSHLPQDPPASRQSEKRKSSILTGKGNQSVSRLEASKDLVDDANAASAVKESHQLITKVSRKRQKIIAPKISKAEAPIDTTLKESLEAEARDAGQMSISKSKHTSHSPPQLVKPAEHVSDVHVSETNMANVHNRARSKRKMYKPEMIGQRSVHPKGKKLYNCLSNQLMRKWCTFEWFYSAIDDPWFAKREFVEYLYHVGLGHVPRLTRVEWGVIRSSLGKPRRFSGQFLKEEKDKLNQYRESVRKHYTELRSGRREGLPTDLARPLSVGQRVVAIYPRTREINDGTVLTVEHDRCCVQFDRPELGVEKIMDTDCMPLNPYENMPASLVHRAVSVDNFFESLAEIKTNGLGNDQKLHSRGNLENVDEVASVKSDLQSRNGPRDIASNQHSAYSVPGTFTQIQAKEADVEAIAELTRALDKKEAVVFELRRMNDDVLENQTDGDFSLQESDAFKKQYAAVLVQLNEANAQVSSALYRLRQRNTYQKNLQLTWPKVVGDSSDHGAISSSSDHTEDSGCHVNEIFETSRTKARTMVDIAIQALSSLRVSQTVDIDQAVDYVNDRLPFDDSCINPVSDPKPKNSSGFRDLNKASIPSELITHCVATLFIIQKCTERQFPPAEVARILDSAVSSVQACSPQNLHVYAEIQKCMGIIKNQILALVPT